MIYQFGSVILYLFANTCLLSLGHPSHLLLHYSLPVFSLYLSLFLSCIFLLRSLLFPPDPLFPLVPNYISINLVQLISSHWSIERDISFENLELVLQRPLVSCFFAYGTPPVIFYLSGRKLARSCIIIVMVDGSFSRHTGICLQQSAG